MYLKGEGFDISHLGFLFERRDEDAAEAALHIEPIAVRDGNGLFL